MIGNGQRHTVGTERQGGDGRCPPLPEEAFRIGLRVPEPHVGTAPDREGDRAAVGRQSDGVHPGPGPGGDDPAGAELTQADGVTVAVSYQGNEAVAACREHLLAGINGVAVPLRDQPGPIDVPDHGGPEAIHGDSTATIGKKRAGIDAPMGAC
jgi:hypothetical protein